MRNQYKNLNEVFGEQWTWGIIDGDFSIHPSMKAEKKVNNTTNFKIEYLVNFCDTEAKFFLMRLIRLMQTFAKYGSRKRGTVKSLELLSPLLRNQFKNLNKVFVEQWTEGITDEDFSIHPTMKAKKTRTKLQIFKLNISSIFVAQKWIFFLMRFIGWMQTFTKYGSRNWRTA